MDVPLLSVDEWEIRVRVCPWEALFSEIICHHVSQDSIMQSVEECFDLLFVCQQIKRMLLILLESFQRKLVSFPVYTHRTV